MSLQTMLKLCGKMMMSLIKYEAKERPCVLQLSVCDLVCLRYKDGCEIKPSDNITLQAEGTMRRLIIRSAEISDAGSYTCQAGTNSMEFTVKIKGTRTFLIDSLVN